MEDKGTCFELEILLRLNISYQSWTFNIRYQYSVYSIQYSVFITCYSLGSLLVFRLLGGPYGEL